MLLLYIHLPAYRQLSRVRMDLLADAEAAIRQFATDTGSEQVHGREGAWLFRLKLSTGGMSRGAARGKLAFCERVVKLQQHLDEAERRLHGYNLLIDEIGPASMQATLETLSTHVLLTNEDRGLWVTDTAASSFDTLFELEAGEVFKVCRLKEEGDQDKTRPPEFCVRESMLDNLLELVQRIHLGDCSERFIVVESEPGDGAVQTVRYLLDAVSANMDNGFLGLTSSVACATRSPAAILGIEGCAEALDLVAHLHDVEKSVWEQLQEIDFDGSTADRVEIDIYQLFVMCLSAYERNMAELLLPPVWVCEGFEELPTWAKEVLLRYVRNASERSGVILVVLVGAEESLKEVCDIPHLLVRTPSLSAEEIQRKISIHALADGDVDGLTEYSLRKPVSTIEELFRRIYLFNQGEFGACIAEDPTERLLMSLPEEQLALWHIRAVAGRLMGASLLDEYLEHAGYDRAAVLAFEELLRDLYLDRDDIRRPVLPAHKREDLMGLIVEFVTEQKATVALRLSDSLVKFVWDHGNASAAAEFVVDYVTRLLESDQVEGARVFLRDLDGDARNPDSLIVLDSLKLRAAVRSGLSSEAAHIFATLKMRRAARDQGVEGGRLLEYTRHFYAIGAFQEGLQSAKDALMIFQREYPEREADACIFVGLHMLAVSKIDEAEAYFGIAGETVSQTSPALIIVSGIYAAATQFMRGDLTQALRISAASLSSAKKAGLRRLELCVHFLVMRIQMELGRYDLCVNLCLEGLTLSALYGGESGPVYARWLRRSQAYMGNLRDAEAGLDGESSHPEELLFLAECCFLNGSYEKAGRYLDCAKIGNGEDRFEAAETVSWRTGFAMLEDRAIPVSGGVSVLDVLIRSFGAFLACYRGRPEQGVNDLALITREDRLSEIDPNNGVYLYQYAHAIGCVSGTGNLDRLTAVSKALKYIQERAAIMDDVSEKQSYLHNNYWNGRILAEARASKLI